MKSQIKGTVSRYKLRGVGLSISNDLVGVIFRLIILPETSDEEEKYTGVWFESLQCYV